MPLIDVEQAVEAVEEIESRWPGPLVAMIPKRDAIIALRALPPAEPTAEEVERVRRVIADSRDLGWGEAKTARAAIAAMKQNGGKER